MAKKHTTTQLEIKICPISKDTKAMNIIKVFMLKPSVHKQIRSQNFKLKKQRRIYDKLQTSII